jgi:uroporphyrinogen-III decarboxylase
MIPPKLFSEYCLDYLPDIFKIYKYNILHLCGKIFHHILSNVYQLETIDGLHVLNIGPYIDIRMIKKVLDNKIGIAGNIDHVKLLPSGSIEQIKRAVHDAIEASGGDYRFIVAPGCEITADTPKENIKAFVNAVKTT